MLVSGSVFLRPYMFFAIFCFFFALVTKVHGRAVGAHHLGVRCIDPKVPRAWRVTDEKVKKETDSETQNKNKNKNNNNNNNNNNHD